MLAGVIRLAAKVLGVDRFELMSQEQSAPRAQRSRPRGGDMKPHDEYRNGDGEHHTERTVYTAYKPYTQLGNSNS